MSVPDLQRMTDEIIAATNSASSAESGTAVTGQSLETGGAGPVGWLSSIRKAITDRLPAALGTGGGLKVDGSGTALPISVASVPSHAVTNAGTFAVQATGVDGAQVTIGAKADAKSTVSDTTAITAMSVWKQISFSVQAIAASVAGSLNVATHAVTQSGTWTVVAGAGTALFGKIAVTGNASATGDTEITAETVGTDGTTNTRNSLLVTARIKAYNAIGDTWDRIRSGAVSNIAAATGYLNALPVGQYNSAAPTITDTRYNHFQLDVNGNLKVTQATLIAGEDQTYNRMSVEEAFSFASITTQTTTTVKSGAGRLQRIIIPTPVASATIKIYDNTAASGTVICDTITLPATLVSDGPITVEFGVAVATGITVVTGGATMAVDVVYI